MIIPAVMLSYQFMLVLPMNSSPLGVGEIIVSVHRFKIISQAAMAICSIIDRARF